MLGHVDVFESAGEQDARVVDHHVEPTAGRVSEFVYPLGHFGAVGDIEMSDDRHAAELVDVIGQRFQADLVDVVAADGIALLGEGQRGRAADSRGGSCDEHGSIGHTT